LKLAALVVLAACGRIDFETSTSTPAFVQSPAVAKQTSSQIVVPASTSAGHLLVVAVDLDKPGAPVMSIDDVAGNTYVSAGARAKDSAVGFATELWYAADTRAFSGDITITLASSNATFVWVAEFAGMATSSPLAAASTLDTGVPEQGTTTSQTITTTVPDELVFVLNANDAGVTAIASGNPFTALPVFAGDDSAYAILTEPGTYSAVWTLPDDSTLTTFCTSVAAFYAAP
jgi:hypothetical protein